jgi:uncharacterized protein (DUF433 family)
MSRQEMLEAQAVFTGTQLPVASLFTYLEEGRSLEEFLNNYPWVSREDAEVVLEVAENYLLSQMYGLE